MWHSYFISSKRNLWRNRKVSLISIVGLAIGLAGGLVLFLLVSYLFSFDRYHAKANRTYWVVTDIRHENVMPTDATPRPLGEVLRRDYPFVESAVRLDNLFGKIVSVPNGKGGFLKKFEEFRTLCFTEPQFFDVFDVRWLEGDAKTALASPNTVVLSKRYAEKYFDDADPIGRILRYDNQINLTVTGLIDNPPSNTKLGYEMLISYSTISGLLGEQGKAEMQHWGDVRTMCFVTLREGTSSEQLINVFPAIQRKYMSPQEAKKLAFHALPLGELDHNPQYGGRTTRPILYALIIVGLFLVAASCINFINLATAQALKRSKEVGVRKTVGSTRWQLIAQFMIETSLVALAAVGVALVLTQVSLPLLNKALAILKADLSILDLFRPQSLIWFSGLVIGVIMLAGLYPSLVLARFNPVAALRGQLTTKEVGSGRVRRGLVVAQFFITQLFIIGVIVMTAQVRHMQQADMGFKKEAILTVPVPTTDPLKQQRIRDHLRQVPGVEQVTLGAEPPASRARMPVPFTFGTHTEPEKFPTVVKVGDMNYASLFGLTILAGRNFRNNDTTNNEAIVNEIMVKQLGFRSPSDILGKRLRIWGRYKIIVGVIRDFHSTELRVGIQPLTLLNYPSENHMAALAVNPTNLPATTKAIEDTWNKLFPEHVYKASFVDDQVAEFYLTERILLGLAEVFALLAILIGCLGLYGLVTFIAEIKTKEIGVRKILGATVGQILWLFGREFGKLILGGFLLAAPVGWFLMKGWLQGYVYRINLNWWVFAMTMTLAVLVTLLTVGYESIKSALSNPGKSLRTE